MKREEKLTDEVDSVESSLCPRFAQTCALSSVFIVARIK